MKFVGSTAVGLLLVTMIVVSEYQPAGVTYTPSYFMQYVIGSNMAFQCTITISSTTIKM